MGGRGWWWYSKNFPYLYAKDDRTGKFPFFMLKTIASPGSDLTFPDMPPPGTAPQISWHLLATLSPVPLGCMWTVTLKASQLNWVGQGTGRHLSAYKGQFCKPFIRTSQTITELFARFWTLQNSVWGWVLKMRMGERVEGGGKKCVSGHDAWALWFVAHSEWCVDLE